MDLPEMVCERHVYGCVSTLPKCQDFAVGAWQAGSTECLKHIDEIRALLCQRSREVDRFFARLRLAQCEIKRSIN